MHKNTVRQWIKQGLPTIDDRRPSLVQGRVLAQFLEARRKRNRQPCGPGEIYCVRCRVPRVPAGGMAEYRVLTATVGNLVGLCPVCESWMFRRVNLARLDEIRAGLDVCVKDPLGHIGEST